MFAAPAVNAILGVIVNADPIDALHHSGRRHHSVHAPDGGNLDWLRGGDRSADDRGDAFHRAAGRGGDPRSGRRPDRDRVSFGASPLQIVFKVLIPEALPGLVLALTLAVVSLLGYSAMVGAVGGGGLGDLGIRYGYQRFMPEMMLAVVVVLIALVQTVQTVGDYFARRVNRRLRHR